MDKTKAELEAEKRYPDFDKLASTMIGFSKAEAMAKMWEILVLPLIENMDSMQQTNQALVKKLQEADWQRSQLLVELLEEIDRRIKLHNDRWNGLSVPILRRKYYHKVVELQSLREHVNKLKK